MYNCSNSLQEAGMILAHPRDGSTFSRSQMGFWPGAEPQVWSLAVSFDADNSTTTADVRRGRFRKGLFYQHPAVAITEESELIKIPILVKRPNLS